MDQTKEKGFTGLEAALVLVAFVVVAAVFSYVVLGGGFFTTQTAQATVYNGVAQASSSMETVGEVMGVKWETGTSQLDYINVSVALSAGGTPIDMSQLVISYSDSNNGRQIKLTNSTAGINDCTDVYTTVSSAASESNPSLWCAAQKINDQNPALPNNLLEHNEIWILSIQTPQTAVVNTKIKYNLQPLSGAGLLITKTLPGGFSKIQVIQ